MFPFHGTGKKILAFNDLQSKLFSNLGGSSNLGLFEIPFRNRELTFDVLRMFEQRWLACTVCR